MKVLFYTLFSTLAAAASYWDSNACTDVNVELPANASKAIVYMLGDDTQEKHFTYELFKSELGPGTSAPGDPLDYIRHDDMNN